MSDAFDSSGDARRALSDIHRDHGIAGIDNETLVGQLLPDLMPGTPRETSLLLAAASAGVGGLLADRINRGVPAEAAVRDVAAMLVDRNALDPAATRWVVSEYAAVIGHPVAAGSLSADPVTPAGTAGGPVFDGTETIIDKGVGSGTPSASPSSPWQRPSPAGYSPQPGTSPQPGYGGQPSYSPQPRFSPPPSPPPAFGQPGYVPQPPTNVVGHGAQAPSVPPVNPGISPTTPFPAVPGIPGQYPAPGQYPPVSGPPGQYVPVSPGMPFPQSGPYPPMYPQTGYAAPAKNRTPLIVGIVVVAVLLIAGGVTAYALASTNNKGKPAAGPSTTASTPPSTPPSSAPPSSPPPTGDSALRRLMPADLDVASDCTFSTTAKAPGFAGLLAHYECNEPSSSNLPGAFVEGFRFDGSSSLSTSLDAFNTYLNVDPNDSATTGKCPPTSAHPGALTWGHTQGQDEGDLECYVAKDDTCVYIWTDTAHDAMFYVGGTKSQTCAKVNDWWINDSDGPG